MYNWLLVPPSSWLEFMCLCLAAILVILVFQIGFVGIWEVFTKQKKVAPDPAQKELVDLLVKRFRKYPVTTSTICLLWIVGEEALFRLLPVYFVQQIGLSNTWLILMCTLFSLAFGYIHGKGAWLRTQIALAGGVDCLLFLKLGAMHAEYMLPFLGIWITHVSFNLFIFYSYMRHSRNSEE